jgi:xanthine dehydrogenase accessory factor
LSERVFSTLAEWLGREPVVLATVLDTRGAVPRHRGALMLIAAERAAFSVGGGRLEASVIGHARRLMQDGDTRDMVAIDLTGRADALGVCGGSLRVALRLWQGPTDARRAHEVVTTLQAGDPVTLAATEIGADVSLHVEADARLLIIGAGHCGLALYRAARALDYDICVHDTRSEGFVAEDFAGRDHAAGPARAGCEYVHAPSPACRPAQSRLPRRRRRPAAAGAARHRLHRHDGQWQTHCPGICRTAEDLADLARRVVAPVGLDIGAETPEEIAISILAQLIAFARQPRA